MEWWMWVGAGAVAAGFGLTAWLGSRFSGPYPGAPRWVHSRENADWWASRRDDAGPER